MHADTMEHSPYINRWESPTINHREGLGKLLIYFNVEIPVYRLMAGGPLISLISPYIIIPYIIQWRAPYIIDFPVYHYLREFPSSPYIINPPVYYLTRPRILLFKGKPAWDLRCYPYRNNGPIRLNSKRWASHDTMTLTLVSRDSTMTSMTRLGEIIIIIRGCAIGVPTVIR